MSAAPQPTLYHLPVEGAGGPMIECLPSYLRRLAALHECSMDVLAGLIAMDAADRKVLVTALRADRGALLSPCETGELVTARLQSCVHGIDFSAMLNRRIADHLMVTRSVRNKPAWCPDCLRQFRDQGSSFYFPLLWQMTTTSACFKHQRRLSTKCYACGTSYRFAGKAGWTSSCFRCGFDHIQEPREASPTPLAVDLAMARKTEALLRWSIPLQTEVESRFVHNIDRLAQLLGSRQKVVKRLGLTHRAVGGWFFGGVPTLENFIRVAAVWDVDPKSLLAGEVEWGDGAGQYDVAFAVEPMASIEEKMEAVALLFEKERCKPVDDHPKALDTLCREIGTRFQTVKVHRPQQAAAMVKWSKDRRASARARLKVAALNRCREIVVQMQRENRHVSRYYVWQELESIGEPHRRQVLAQFPVVMRAQGMV